MTNRIAEDKLDNLRSYLQDLGSVAVAFSSGVDSTFLLKVAFELLGDKAIAVTLKSETFPSGELNESREFCEKEGIEHVIVEADQFSIEGFGDNPENRCYICKKDIFTKILAAAKERGISHVIDGSNSDDIGDFRPGMQALSELDIKSPLRDCGLSKAEIRALSCEMGLPTWDKPSYACLATRIPYGEEITKEKLGMIEHAENYLINLGFRQMRVRFHGGIARIEILPDEIDRFMDEDIRRRVNTAFKEIGFDYVTLDLSGYRSGSMNEVLDI